MWSDVVVLRMSKLSIDFKQFCFNVQKSKFSTCENRRQFIVCTVWNVFLNCCRCISSKKNVSFRFPLLLFHFQFFFLSSSSSLCFVHDEMITKVSSKCSGKTCDKLCECQLKFLTFSMFHDVDFAVAFRCIVVDDGNKMDRRKGANDVCVCVCLEETIARKKC